MKSSVHNRIDNIIICSFFFTEEKKARKQALKDLRRERRVERKTNRDAFKEEKVKQEKNAMNLKLNFGQSIKLL